MYQMYFSQLRFNNSYNRSISFSISKFFSSVSLIYFMEIPDNGLGFLKRRDIYPFPKSGLILETIDNTHPYFLPCKEFGDGQGIFACPLSYQRELRY